MLAPPASPWSEPGEFYATTPPLTLTPRPSPRPADVATPDISYLSNADYFGFKPWVPCSTSSSSASTPAPSSPVLPSFSALKPAFPYASTLCTCRPLRPSSPFPSPEFAYSSHHPPALKLRPKRSRPLCELHQKLPNQPTPLVELHLRPPPSLALDGCKLSRSASSASGFSSSGSSTAASPAASTVLVLPKADGERNGKREKDLPFPPRGSSRAALWDLTMGNTAEQQQHPSLQSPTLAMKHGEQALLPPAEDVVASSKADDSPATMKDSMSLPEVSRWSSDTLLSSVASGSRRGSIPPLSSAEGDEDLEPIEGNSIIDLGEDFGLREEDQSVDEPVGHQSNSSSVEWEGFEELRQDRSLDAAEDEQETATIQKALAIIV